MKAEHVALELVSGERAFSHLSELRALYSEVYADPPYEWGDEHTSLFAERFQAQCRQDGFSLVEARDGRTLAGIVFGLPVRPVSGSSVSWQNLTSPVPAEVAAEWPGRTFFIVELLVRAPWRRQHIAQAMHDLLLKGRPEERAMLTALPAAEPAQAAYRKWGWHKVAQKRNPLPGSPVFDVMIEELAHPCPVTGMSARWGALDLRGPS
jgi:ribosomal protein S18 acetylase RimI-like enzyme